MLQRTRRLIPAILLLVVTGCLSARARRSLDSAEGAVGPRLDRAGYAASAYETDPDAVPEDAEEVERAELLASAAPPALPAPVDDAALGKSIELATVEAVALERHPLLREGALRVRAMAAEARSLFAYPDPVFMTEIQAVPFDRPYRVDQASMAMVGLRQQIPAAGSLEAMSEGAAIEAQAEAAMLGGRARELLREVDRAFADYAEASEVHRAHMAHVTLFERMAAAARARYSAGGTLADVTRAELEGLMLEQHIAHAHGDMLTGAARLNNLMARPVSAPLGPARWGEPMTVAASTDELVAQALARQPELVAAELRARAAERMADAADAMATVPEFMVSGAVFLPVSGMMTGWGASFGMSLPWLWSGASDRAESYRNKALAERAARDTVRLRLQGDIDALVAAVRANAGRLALLRDRALPAARRAVAAAEAGYATGGSDVLMWLDAVRAEVDVTVDISMVRAELERALADVDWTVGAHVARAPLSKGTPSHEEMRDVE
ncbi:MAG: TolC family protein [Polyangiaceae bacterium]|nr:TolC family protein [Polyangiaceae bacterium]